MKLVLKLLLVAVSALVLLFVLQLVASESGEVVVLTTEDGAGQAHETRLWVVEYDNDAWLRAGSPESAWYQRLRENAQVMVTRDGVSFEAVAEPEVDQREPINQLINDKYGWADDFISLLFGRDDAVPVRLRQVTD